MSEPVLRVGAKVRRLLPVGSWRRVTSLSENFATFDGADTAPVSRRVLEDAVRQGRVEVAAQ